MTNTAPAETALHPGFTRDAFETMIAARREPDWLVAMRRDAWETFESLPLPSRREEEWMRTDIRLLRLERFGLPVDSGSVDASKGRANREATAAEAVLTVGVDLAGRTTTVDSHPATSQIDPELTSQGVVFGPLEDVLAEHGQRLRPWLERRLIPPTVDKFAALQAACFSGGSVLYVPRGVRIEKPLHALTALASGNVDLSRTLVVLEEGAEATLLGETAGGDQPSLHCGAIELFVGPGARLRYVNLQNWGPGVWHFAHQTGRVDRDGALQWTIGALGARLAKVNQHVHLAGAGARAQVNGVMFTEGRQHLAYHTLQHHEAPGCQSNLLYKGALQDDSRLVWRGMIKVAPGAQKTDGYQRNDNLMLSQGSRADSIPGLEIEADDVRCTHGSTAGRVDDEQVFYARCRGLSRKEAVRMIVAGFFQQVFDRITLESVREALGHAIGRRIREYD